MCGIAGFWGRFLGIGCGVSVIARCVATMKSRGPDASGSWHDDGAGVALGHARLSILDLSENGAQPMVSHCGRWVISYNGEVYNFGELRLELEAAGEAFRGGSDTEVMLAAMARWGIPAAVKRFVGMFAFAVWDRQENALTLVRDRLGIKPLYYGLRNGIFAFASVLAPFRELEGFGLEIDRDALSLLFRYNCIPAPHSIYRGVFKLLPGHWLTVRRGDLEAGVLPRPDCFWDARRVVEGGKRNPFAGSSGEAVEALDEKLRLAIRQRMIADVPLGAFLSGGIDSSVVTSLMQAQSSRPVKTFSIGAPDIEFDEAPQAKRVAEALGTDHTELYVSRSDVLGVIPRLPDLFDEPFSDSSQLPTFLVCQLARKEVTVALSGDGGDELFGGYHRYNTGERVWRAFARMPRFFRRAVGKGLTAFSPGQWDRSYQALSRFIPSTHRIRMPGYRAHRLASVLDCRSPDDLYRTLVTHWDEPGRLVLGAKEPLVAVTDPERQLPPEISDCRERMMYLDLVGYLGDDILTKLDRTSMGVSLEARVPLIDHRVVEFAWQLPLNYKIREGEGKWILRRVLEKYLPPKLFQRPKMGFGLPIGKWLRTDLLDWAEDLLDEGRMEQEGFLDAQMVSETWRAHLAGGFDYGYHIWDVLMFNAWLRR